MFFTVTVFLITLAGFNSAAPDWSHHDEEAWPGKCGSGREQSPIDIQPSQTMPDPFGVHIRGELDFQGYNNVPVRASNTGYKLQYELAPNAEPPTLCGGPLRSNYSFVEAHFHWLSEHSVDGIKYPIEVHIVHRRSDLSLNEALEERDGLAVLGILGEVTSTGQSHVLDDYVQVVDSILTPDQGETGVFNVDLTSLFPSNPQAFYTYHGSLTTPQCPEVVTWIVMENLITVTHSAYKNFSRTDMDGINNDRAVQPLNQRLVYRSNQVSSGNSVAPSTLSSLAALLGIFGTKISSSLLKGVNSIWNAKKRFFAKASKKSVD